MKISAGNTSGHRFGESVNRSSEQKNFGRNHLRGGFE